MIDSIINCKDPLKSDAVILGAAYGDGYFSKKNSHVGPAGVIPILHRELELFDRLTLTEPAYLYKIAYKNIKSIGKLTVEKALRKITDVYDKLNKQFVVILGGSHIVSLGAFRSIKKRHSAKDITIVQIDAHPDLRDDDSDYKKNASPLGHGCVMKRAYDLGYNIVNVGARTYSKKEYEFFKKNKRIKIFEWGRKEKHTVQSIIKSIKTKKVYLTIDCDGLDPSYASSTKYPFPGGLLWDFVQELLIKLSETKNIIGADITEISPNEKSKLTQYTAAQVCYNVISYKLTFLK